MVSDQLALPVTEWMSARSAYPESKSSGYFRNCFSQKCNILICFVNISANVRSHFNNSLVHFSLNFVFNNFLPFIHDFLLMTSQLARRRINHHVFFFNPKSEEVARYIHHINVCDGFTPVKLFMSVFVSIRLSLQTHPRLNYLFQAADL